MKPKQEISHKFQKIGTYEKGENLFVWIRIPLSMGWIERVKCSLQKGENRTVYPLRFARCEDGYAYFEEVLSLETQAVYHYYFSFEANGKFYYYKKSCDANLHEISLEETWKLSVGFSVPEWAKGGMMYHIFVDRYRRGSQEKPFPLDNRKIHTWDEPVTVGPDEDGLWNVDFYGGDLKGIQETLGYLQKLGVEILFLSPIVYGMSNHRYDTKDYEQIDPYLGTEEDLRNLCEEAHKRGMHIILDAVFNHTGNDSRYFNEYGHFAELGAYQSMDSPYYPWYRKTWQNGCETFAYWWGMKNLPVCDGENPDWQKYILGEGGIIDKWFHLGIDGLRLDVADELTDEFIEQILVSVKRNRKDGFVLGEVWKNPMRMNRGYIACGKAMHSVMNYPLVDALLRYFKSKDTNTLKHIWQEIQMDYPEDTILALMNFTSTHDISRIIEFFGCEFFQPNGEWIWDLGHQDYEWIRKHKLSTEEYRRGKMRLKAYYATLIFLPGIVSIFYGDEVGLQGIGNLANRAPYPWKKRDKDLLHFFRQLGKIRKNYPLLRKAETRLLELTPSQMAWERFSEEGEKMLAIISREEERKTEVFLPEDYLEGKIAFESGWDGKVLAPCGILAMYLPKKEKK